MSLEFVFFVFGCVLIVRTSHIVAIDADVVNSTVGSAVDANDNFVRPTTSDTITLLDNSFKEILTDETAGNVIRHETDALAKILSSPNGRRNLVTLMHACLTVFTEENVFKIIERLRQTVIVYVRNEKTGKEILRNVVEATSNIADQPNLVRGAEDTVAGIEYFLKNLSDEQLRKGLPQLKPLVYKFMLELPVSKLWTWAKETRNSVSSTIGWDKFIKDTPIAK